MKVHGPADILMRPPIHPGTLVSATDGPGSQPRAISDRVHTLPITPFTQAGKPWPIPRRRFELSTLLVAEFACLLLIAPFFLILGHGSQIYSWPVVNAVIFHTAVTQTVEAVELVLGVLALLTLPFFPRRCRATLMTMLGFAILILVYFIVGQQGSFWVILVEYPAVALLALVSLDALTGIRPAVADSESFNNRQLALGSSVIILWFLPTVLLFTGHTVQGIILDHSSSQLFWLLEAAMLGAMGDGIIALVGHFSRFRRWVNLIGRLCGTLALTVTMGLGLWCAMRNSAIIGPHRQYLHPELLWIFMLVSAALLLVWSGLTQIFIFLAALERGEMDEE